MSNIKYSTLKKLSLAKNSDVLKILSSINYNKTKSKHIVQCAKILVKEHGSKVPQDFNLLITLPGVGRKTANVFLSEIGGANIGIDTHVNYISHKLGWTKSKTQEKIENDLKKAFPKRYHNKLNEVLVTFGKTYTSKKEKDLLLLQAKKLSK